MGLVESLTFQDKKQAHKLAPVQRFPIGRQFLYLFLYICSYMDGLTSFVSCTNLLVTLLLSYHSLCSCSYNSHERTEWVLMQVY